MVDDSAEGFPSSPRPRDSDERPSAIPPSSTPEAEAAPEFVWSTDTSSPTSFSPWAAPGSAPAVAVRERRSLGSQLGRLARDLLETIILALLIFLAVRAMVQNFRVEGSSMQTSLHDGQYILINKAIYTKVNLGFLDFLPFFDAGDDPNQYIFRPPQRGDVVVFRFPNDPTRDFIKRVIAEPGEVVEVRDGLVLINGKPLEESYITNRPHYSYGPKKVPPKHYFVLGDNRNNSYDSHVWGMLSEDNIIGQAWISYWPFSSFGLIDNSHAEPMGSEGADP
jgi:signal peptidase I